MKFISISKYNYRELSGSAISYHRWSISLQCRYTGSPPGCNFQFLTPISPKHLIITLSYAARRQTFRRVRIHSLYSSGNKISTAESFEIQQSARCWGDLFECLCEKYYCQSGQSKRHKRLWGNCCCSHCSGRGVGKWGGGFFKSAALSSRLSGDYHICAREKVSLVPFSTSLFAIDPFFN